MPTICYVIIIATLQLRALVMAMQIGDLIRMKREEHGLTQDVYKRQKYDVRPGLYTEPGRGPPGLLPTNKADILEVMKEVHHPDIVNVVVHFISPFSNGGRYEAYGRRTAPANSLKNTFRWLALFDTTSRALGGSRRTVLAHITGISSLRGSLRAAPIA